MEFSETQLKVLKYNKVIDEYLKRLRAKAVSHLEGGGELPDHILGTTWKRSELVVTDDELMSSFPDVPKEEFYEDPKLKSVAKLKKLLGANQIDHMTAWREVKGLVDKSLFSKQKREDLVTDLEGF